MTRLLISAIAPGVIITLGLVPVIGLEVLQRFRDHRHPRRSPLTKNMLRGPGHSLRQKIAAIDADVNLCVVTLAIIPISIFSMHVSMSYIGNMPESTGRALMTSALALFLFLPTALQLLRKLQTRKHYILGFEGELATAEELNQLMLEGCRVFHDVPFPYGNIDHVVVSQSGVFAVNTKVRGKLKEGGSAEVVVDHTQERIRFPSGCYDIPTKQLESESRWLEKFLSEATGTAVTAAPILALPGWFIKERIGRSSVCVINPQKATKFFVHTRQSLSAELVSRIAYQLDRLCRDVEASYQTKHEW